MSKVYVPSVLPLFVQLVLLYQSRNTVVGQLKKVLQQRLYTKRKNSRKVKDIDIKFPWGASKEIRDVRGRVFSSGAGRR